MAKNRVFEGQYAEMDFGDYEYREYPKWVKSRRLGDDGKPKDILVSSKSEELKLIDEIVPVEELDSVQLERDTLAKGLDEAQKLARAKDDEIAALKAQLAAKPSPEPEVKAPAKPGVKI